MNNFQAIRVFSFFLLKLQSKHGVKGKGSAPALKLADEGLNFYHLN